MIDAPDLYYKMEYIKGTWSMRKLKRQINSLSFEKGAAAKNHDLSCVQWYSLEISSELFKLVSHDEEDKQLHQMVGPRCRYSLCIERSKDEF